MSGKRLLDAARIYGAFKAVARSHIALRSQQIDSFTKTSTLAKAVKDQTDRVTVTAGAAFALAKRLNESEAAQSYTTQRDAGHATPRQDYGQASHAHNEEGLAQDHHYKRSLENEVEDRVPDGELHIRQDRPSEAPLPDGTAFRSKSPTGHAVSAPGVDVTNTREPNAPPVDPLEHNHTGQPDMEVVQKRAQGTSLPDGTVLPGGRSPGRTERLVGTDTYTERPSGITQHSLEEDHAPEHELHPREADDSTIPDPSFAARKGQQLSESQIPSNSATTEPQRGGADTFSARSQDASPNLPSLPRSKIPKHAETSEGIGKVSQQSINQESFYSPSAEAKRDSMSANDIPADVNLNVFHSPRIAGLMESGGTEDRRKAYQMRMDAARRQHQPPSVEKGKPTKAEESDTRDLAGSIAADVSQPTESLSASNDESGSQYQMQESRVPASRLGRIWQFGGLATSMALGAVGETFRRATGGSTDGSVMLSEANMTRLVAKLSKMRGAALKLGQMMSFQDSKMLPPAINAVLQRVQDSADYMPPSQRDKVMASSLGPDWKKLFSSFDDVPIAAASIGQVHKATLASNGRKVAVKVQYPGVRSSITSDLNNISLLLTAGRLLPKGLYLDKTIANAQTELAWECDYIREAECGERFAGLVKDEQSIFTVPKVFKEASGKEVLTAEYMSGVGVTKIKDLSQSERDWIGSNILRLCLRELMEWRFMQTDPNWTNFLYNRQQKKLELLDFGASREYPEKFVKPYVELLIAASKKDRAVCRDKSIELGYLTGVESQAMLNAHVDSVLTLAEPFMEDAELEEDGTYDFRDQTITDRVRANIGLMVRERLAPPPEETYSLHRKLSGAFLLCARLGSRIRTREMFTDAVAKWRSQNAAAV